MQEGHHEAEQAHSLGQGEAQDSEGEQLLLQARVPGISDDQAAEHGPDPSSGPGDSHSGGSSPDELCRGVDVRLGGGGGEPLGGLDGDRPHAADSGHGEAGRHGEAGNGRHGQAGDQVSCRSESSNKSLVECMKTGVDNPGHPHIKTVGLVACDEECYEVFAELFDPVISDRHGGYGPDAKQPTNMDINKLSTTDIDPNCEYVLTTRVRTGASSSHQPFPSRTAVSSRPWLSRVSLT